MFGVVPYPLWSKRTEPDERRRIPLAMRCLLVEHSDGPVLIDTGLGNKEDAKFLDIYGVENSGLEGATQLEDALATAGFLPRDINWVVNTHLHFDHAGGNTTMDPDLEDDPRRHVRATFPNATYVVQKGELEFARNTNERTRASYLPHNFEPIAAASRWRLLEGDGDVLPGISVRVTPGHVPWHQIVLIRDRGETAAFVADLVPDDGPPAAALDHGVRPRAARGRSRASAGCWTTPCRRSGGWCSSTIPGWPRAAGEGWEGHRAGGQVEAPRPSAAKRGPG